MDRQDNFQHLSSQDLLIFNQIADLILLSLELFDHEDPLNSYLQQIKVRSRLKNLSKFRTQLIKGCQLITFDQEASEEDV